MVAGAHRLRRPVHGRRRSASRSRWPTSSGSSRRDPTAPGSRRSWRSRPTRRACPTRPTRCWPRWATTSSTPTPWSTPSPGTPTATDSKHDMGGDIVPDFVVPRRGRRLRLQAQRRARVGGPRPGLLARRRDARRVLRGADGPRLGAPDLQPLQLRVADLHAHGLLPAGQVRARLARPDRPRGELDRLPRLRGLRRAWSRTRCCRRTSRCTAGRP